MDYFHFERSSCAKVHSTSNYIVVAQLTGGYSNKYKLVIIIYWLEYFRMSFKIAFIFSSFHKYYIFIM